MKYLCDGKWVSEYEFEEWLSDRSVHDLAEMSCENISYTLQMLSLCLSLAEKAQILYIEMRAK